MTPFMVRIAAVAGIFAGAAGFALAAQVDLPASPPLPAPSPIAPVEEAPADVRTDAIPDQAPLPELRPEPPEAKVEDQQEPRLTDPAAVARITTPAEETACRARLKDLGVTFEEEESMSDPSGCFIANPIVVTGLGNGITLKPEAVMNCAMAEAAARFAQDTIAPNMKSAFGTELAGIDHASAYICRPRSGTGKLSEHAFGNALDIAAFELADKRRIDVKKAEDDKEANFLASIRSAACGPFKTVLGPGNADHDTHFHFDLQPRRNGGTYCR
ncbi:MAG TPA: extensin family protein [Rhizobiaceae bacterium]|nr:extensin family protein [Rhizobiaceae bacterium]